MAPVMISADTIMTYPDFSYDSLLVPQSDFKCEEKKTCHVIGSNQTGKYNGTDITFSWVKSFVGSVKIIPSEIED